jgi:histone deacetylase 1/2
VLGKEDFVCKFLKALYRLKQAPRAWYSKIDSFLNEKGLLKLNVDYNLYYFEEGGRIAIHD